MAEKQESPKSIQLDEMARPESQRTLTPSVPGSESGKRQTDEEAAVQSDNKEGEPSSSEPQDPNAVGWDGDDDPNNPMNWTPKKKWGCIGALSLMTLLT